eukprot:s3639_g2.t1
MHQCEELCRHFWHLDGQITNWSEIIRILYGQQRMMAGVQESPQGTLVPNRNGAWETSGQVNQLMRPDFAASASTACWWNDLSSLSPEEGSGRARYVATWFVSPGRFPICLQYKRVKIEDSDDFRSFRRRALFAWQALLDDQSVEFHLVEGNPPRAATIVAHVIIVQGKLPQNNFVLFHGVSMPSSRRTRAVLFDQGMTVREFLTQAQFPEACQQQIARCYVRCQIGHEYHSFDDEQVCDVPVAAYVEGDLRLIQVGEEAYGSEDDEDGTTVTTGYPVSERTDAESVISLLQEGITMSASLPWEPAQQGTDSFEHDDMSAPSQSLSIRTLLRDRVEGNLDLHWSQGYSDKMHRSQQGDLGSGKEDTLTHNSSELWLGTCDTAHIFHHQASLALESSDGLFVPTWYRHAIMCEQLNENSVCATERYKDRFEDDDDNVSEFEPLISSVGSSGVSTVIRRMSRDDSDHDAESAEHDFVEHFCTALQDTLIELADVQVWTWGSSDSCQRQSEFSVSLTRDGKNDAMNTCLHEHDPSFCSSGEITDAVRQRGEKAILRDCREGNLDLSESHGCFPQDSRSSKFREQETDMMNAPHRNLPLLPKRTIISRNVSRSDRSSSQRTVAFASHIQVYCFFDDITFSATVNQDHFQACVRSMWHLDGQVSNPCQWQRVCGHFDETLREPNVHEGDFTQQRNSDEMSGNGTITDSDKLVDDPLLLQTLLQEQSLPIFADTWYLDKERFPVCVRPRKLRLLPQMHSEARLKRACRSLWQDLDNHDSIELQIVHGTTRLPSIKLHILVVQGDMQGWDRTIITSQMLPPLYQSRAVASPVGIRVLDFFDYAQFGDVCHQRARTCYVKFKVNQEDVLLTTHMVFQPPLNPFLEGCIRSVNDDIESASSDDAAATDAQSTLSQDTTATGGSVDEDESSLMSGHPTMMQVTDEDAYPWIQHPWDDPPVVEEEIDIDFAEAHETHVEEYINMVLDAAPDPDQQWTAITFGVEIVDIGRRDVSFSPWDLNNLLGRIHEAWADYAARARLTVYYVFPQPSDIGGERSLVLIVNVESPETLEEDTRYILVTERGVPGTVFRSHPYAARVTTDVNARAILAQLNLHRQCFPFTVRPCDVRMAFTSMTEDRPYNIEHGANCNVWFGDVPGEIQLAQTQIQDVDSFLLQVNAMRDYQGARDVVICRVHGVSPQNQPLGYRDVYTAFDQLQGNDWILQIKQLWPFPQDHVHAVFVASATEDGTDHKAAIYHFVVAYGDHEGAPVLVGQQIVAVEAPNAMNNDVLERWAIVLDEVLISEEVVHLLQRRPFWFEPAQRLNVRPHFRVNGVRLADTGRQWAEGDYLQARFLVWQPQHILHIMTGEREVDASSQVEHTSFLQVLSVMPTANDIRALHQEEQLFTQNQNPEQEAEQISHSCKQSIQDLQRLLWELEQPEWHGFNNDFQSIPNMHPFAAVACEITPQVSRRQQAARHLMAVLQCKAEKCRGLHIKAHCGHPWNETADSLAVAIRKGWAPENQAKLRSAELLAHPLSQFAWIEASQNNELPGLETLLKNAPPDPDKDLRNIDATLLSTNQGPRAKPRTTMLRLASANVQTLDYQGKEFGVSTKVEVIMQQMVSQGVHILALQETRARCDRTAVIGPYTRLISAAEQGQAGVELWLDAPALSKVFGFPFAPTKEACVWFHSPRIMATTCNFGNVQVEIFVLYAPQQGRPVPEIQKWWDELDSLISRVRPGIPVFLLGDCNAHVGSVESTAIGHCHADLEDLSGTLLRELCEKHELLIPSTFSLWHQGDGHTYTGPRGHKSRIDFIAVSQQCASGIVQSWVDEELDLLNGHKDHHVLCMDMQLVFAPKSDDNALTRKSLYDRAAAKENKKSGFHDLSIALPSQAWDVDVNKHWNAIRMSLQSQSQTMFPKTKRQKRQPYFDQQTWQSLCDRKDLRQQHRALQRDHDRCLLKACFAGWKQNHDLTEDFRITLHQFRLQDAVLIEARRKLDHNFRTAKRRAWKEWVEQKLHQDVGRLNKSKAENLFQVLQPKKAIAKTTGHLLRPLPGLQDATGEWHKDRQSIAMAWQAQFSQVENAEPVQFQDLVARSNPLSEIRTVQDLADLPTVFDLERAIRTMKCEKSPGLDSLGAELFQVNPATMARRLYPLFVKSALRAQGVTELAGGWLLALYKGKGNPKNMASHRGILLEAVTARMFSRAWRVKIVSGLERLACPMQFGGRAGLSIEALHLHVKMMMQNAASQKAAHALLFIDIRSAFYSIAKPLLAGPRDDIDKIRHIFDVMELPDSVWEAFLANVQEANLVSRATSSSLIAQGIASNLDQTWFAIPDGLHASAPLTGSRPGDPMADVLFALVMSRILHLVTIRARAENIDLLPFTVQGELSRMVTWVDDLAISIQTDAERLVSQTIQVAAIVQECMLEHGLSLSYGAGKSAMMFTFHGKGSTKARQSFEATYKRGVPVLTEYQSVVHIPVVTHYRHLGGHLARNGSVLPEIKIRLARTMSKLHPLRRILTCGDLQVERRRELVRAMGLTVLTLHSGTWWRLTQAELSSWHAAWFQVCHVIHGRNSDGNVPHFDYFQLSEAMQCAMPMEMLYLQRLKLLFHLLKVGDNHMITAVLHNAHVAGDDSWLHAALQSLKWMQQQLGSEEVPAELFTLNDRQTWHDFHDATHELHKLLKKAEKAHLLRIKTLIALKTHAVDHQNFLREMGWDLPQTQDAQRDGASFSCSECDKIFDSAAALAVHQQRSHQQRVAVRRLVSDGACRACGKTFHTRPRLIHHLQHGQTACWCFHFRTYQPMSVEQANELDRQDRANGTVLHNKSFQDVEKNQIWRWATDAEMEPHLPCVNDGETSTAPPTQQEIEAWSILGMLPAGRGGRSKTVRHQGDLHLYNVAYEIAQLEETLKAQVGQWQRARTWVPKPLADGRKFVLILFSGHRRDFDLAQYITWTSNLIPINIDLAIDHNCGNILNDSIWRDLIRSRKVSGAHGAPPCETFSLARWVQVDDVDAPRPLRTAEEPWGVSHRSLREVEQVTIGNLLMVKTLYLLTMVFFFGGSLTLEHPAEIWDKSQKWTIWDSAFLHQLLTLEEMYKVRFLQGPLGRPFSKPTNLLVGRINNMQQIIYNKYDRWWKPSEKLGGRAGGKWKTAQAKTYPPRLCQALAEGHVKYSEGVQTQGWEADPPQLQEYLECLARQYDPYLESTAGTIMRGDYDRSAAFAASIPSKEMK